MEMTLIMGGAWRFMFSVKGDTAMQSLRRREIHHALVSTTTHGCTLQVPQLPWCTPDTHRRPDLSHTRQWISGEYGSWRLKVGERGESEGRVYTP